MLFVELASAGKKDAERLKKRSGFVWLFLLQIEYSGKITTIEKLIYYKHHLYIAQILTFWCRHLYQNFVFKAVEKNYRSEFAKNV